MGAWGHGIKQDDLVCDVISAFEEQLKLGESSADATIAVRNSFKEAIEDSDDGPLFWIGLADAQWTFGQLEPTVLQHVKDDLDSGRSLSRWDENTRDLDRRRSALLKFINKIEIPNARPKKRPKKIVRKPIFEPGDCLSVLLENGQYGAAIVIAADHSNAEYGMNLVGVLDYMAPEKPTLEVFQERKWLYRSHHSWKNELALAWYIHVGFRKMKTRLGVIGRVNILGIDPKARMEGIAYSGWQNLGKHIIWQREWDNSASNRK